MDQDLLSITKEKTKTSKNVNILEIGPGNNLSLSINFLNTNRCLYHTVDFNHLDSLNKNHQHFISDFLYVQLDTTYDIIIDRCVWHEQDIRNRQKYLKKIYSLLKKDGYFFGEHATYHTTINFQEDDLLFDHEKKVLYQQKNDVIKAVKYIPKALKIEQDLQLNNFKIIRFICDPTKKIICNRSTPIPRPGDPDHLYFQTQKN